MKRYHSIDRASGTLDAQLLSSTTSGNFTVGSLSILGSQDWDTPSGEYAILTIEDEQILVTLSESGGTLTCTIVTRGYNNTTAATHAASTAVEIHLTSEHYEALKDELVLRSGGLASVETNPTITDATTLSVASEDVTSIYTVGRVLLVKVSGTWHRCVVRSSSFSTNTTINVSSDTLPSSGTVQDFGIALSGNDIHSALDYLLVKNATNLPANNPPSGYSWVVNKGGQWYSVDSSGDYRFLGKVIATVASSSGTLTLDGSVANVWDVTLTENVTTITMQNCIDGTSYVLRVKQHASSAKTVAVPASWRFGAAITAWVMTATVGKIDYVGLIYHAGDDKYDVLSVSQDF